MLWGCSGAQGQPGSVAVGRAEKPKSPGSRTNPPCEPGLGLWAALGLEIRGVVKRFHPRSWGVIVTWDVPRAGSELRPLSRAHAEPAGAVCTCQAAVSEVQRCIMPLLLIPVHWGIGFATLFLCLEQLSCFQKKIALLQFWFPPFERCFSSSLSLCFHGTEEITALRRCSSFPRDKGVRRVAGDSPSVPPRGAEGHSPALEGSGEILCLAPALGCGGRHLYFTHRRLTPCSAEQSSGWAQACCASFYSVNTRMCKTTCWVLLLEPEILLFSKSSSTALLFGSWSLSQVSVDCDQSSHCTIAHTAKLKCVCLLCWDILQE